MEPIAGRKALFLRKNVVGSALRFPPLRSRDLRLAAFPNSLCPERRDSHFFLWI